MRRLSFTVLLATTVVLTGCFTGKTTGSASGGQSKGEAGSSFSVNVFLPPVGGTISSGEASPSIDRCGESNPGGCGTLNADGFRQTIYAWTDTVVLTATPDPGKVLISWAGDCSGNAPTCTLTAGADKTVVAVFGEPGSGHPNFTDPATHARAFLGVTLVCTTCHGARLEGASIAPACAACHNGAAARPPPPGGFVQPSVGFSHPIPDWSSTATLRAAHGAAYAGNSLACRSCHGADLQGSSGYPSCSQCHAVPPPPPVAISIDPANATLDACGGRAFTATVTNTLDTAVSWTVVEADGGSVTNGAYVAPQVAGTYHIVATSHADPATTARATITVGPERVLSVAIVPGGSYVLPGGTISFSASVTTSCGTFSAQ
jgi:hypothetical protein